MAQHVILISKIIINFNVSVKNIARAKSIGILALEFVIMLSIQKVLMIP